MAATNFTPIQLYHSTTAAAVPVNTNLVNGELAINITDGKLYYKDNGGTVQIIASKGTGTIGGSTTQVQYNSSGALAGSANFTFNGTTATINTLNLTNALGATYGGTAQSSWTTGDLLYASGSNTLAKLGIGLNTYILTSNGTIPGWAAPSAISVNTATNLAGGAAGSVPYQSGAGATTFLSIGTANQVVTSTGSAPQWSSGLSITTLTASDAVTFSATTQNIALGTSQTSGTFTAGGAAQTGTQTVGQSTKTHTLNIGTGATESGATKTVNLATAGVSGSTTTMSVGSAVSGAITNLTVNATTTLAPVARSTGAVSYFTVTTPADTGLTASTEVIGSSFTAATRTWATGALTLQRERVFAAPTYAFAGASTLTTAVNVDIGLPVAGTNATITNAYALRASNTLFTGDVVLNNASAALDLTNLEVTNIKAKDGTASMTLADTTGAVTVSSAFAANGGVTIGDASGDAFTINSSAVSTPNGLNFDSNTFVIDAANNRVGIGLSNPSTTLQVYGEGQFGGTTTSASTGLSVNTRSGDAGSIKVRFDAASSNQNSYLADWYSTEASYIRFNRNASTSASSIAFATSPAGASFAPVANMTLDSSGNLGLGVAPSASWGTSFSRKAFQFGPVGSVNSLSAASANNQSFFSHNLIDQGSGTYSRINTDWVSQYRQYNGTHTWQTSTTSSGAVTLSDLMTLDASGNLLIGTTSARTTLTVAGSISLGATPAAGVAGTAYSITGNSALSSTAAGGDLTIAAGGGSGVAVNGNLILRAGQTVSPLSITTGGNLVLESGKPSDGATGGYIAFNTYAGSPSTATERARITSGGQFAMTYDGTNAAPAISFTNDLDTGIFRPTNNQLGFATAGVQAMTLDASGNLGIGTTSPVSNGATFATLSLNGSNGGALHFLNANTTVMQLYNDANAFFLNASSGKTIVFQNASAECARITSGGIFQVSSGGSVQVGGTAARATTAGTNRLDIFNGTAPVGTLTNGISIYSSSGEAYVMDAAGNATLFSPHDAETNEWIFKSKHTPTGKVLKIDVERLLKFVNDHFGLDAVHEFVEE